MSTSVSSRTRGPGFVVGMWALSRLILLAAAGVVGLKMHWTLTRLVMHWDALWYDRIAKSGYGVDPHAIAFFPGWPMVLKGCYALGIPASWSGPAVSTLCSLGAALALWRIAGSRDGAWAAVAWCFAPMTVFTSVVYTESLFCLFAFWAWERMLRGRWAQMAVLLALACSVRVTGVFLVIAVFVWILTRPRRSGLTAGARVLPTLWLAIPTALVLAWIVYLHHLTGDWTAWYSAQVAGWKRGFTMPWRTFYNTLQLIGPLRDQTSLGFSEIHVFEILSWLIGAAAGLWCLAKRRWAEAVFLLIQAVGFGTAAYFISVNRALLVWFPVWLMVGAWLGNRRAPAWRVAWLVVSGLLAFAWAFLCLRGYWCS